MYKNLVIICIDSLRADGTRRSHEILTGHKSDVKTPNLDDFINKGSYIKKAYSTNTYTTSAHASLFTGTYPYQHNIRAFFDFNQKLSFNTNTIAEILNQNNFQTFFYSDIKELFSEMDIWRGFKIKTHSNTDWLWNSIEDLKKDRNFIFLHTFDIHEPYLFSEDKSDKHLDDYYHESLKDIKGEIGFKSNTNSKEFPHDSWMEIKDFIRNNQIPESQILRKYYDKGIENFDQIKFPNILEKLNKLGFNLKNSIFIILSDHGEGSTDFGNICFSHGGELTEEVIRIFLSFNIKIDQELLSIANIKKIALDNLGIKLNKNNHNNSLSKHIYAESFLNFVGKEIAHGLTDRGSLIKISTKKNIQPEYKLSSRSLINMNQKIIIKGKPEFVIEKKYENINDSENLVIESFNSLFSRPVDTPSLKNFRKELKTKNITRTQFLDILLNSDEYKKKYPIQIFKTFSELKDKKINTPKNYLKQISWILSNTGFNTKKILKSEIKYFLKNW